MSKSSKHRKKNTPGISEKPETVCEVYWAGQPGYYLLQVQAMIESQESLAAFEEKFQAAKKDFVLRMNVQKALQNERRTQLIKLFTFEGRPYRISYRYRQHQAHSNDLPILQQMIREGTVQLVETTSTLKTYEYCPKQGSLAGILTEVAALPKNG